MTSCRTTRFWLANLGPMPPVPWCNPSPVFEVLAEVFVIVVEVQQQFGRGQCGPQPHNWHGCLWLWQRSMWHDLWLWHSSSHVCDSTFDWLWPNFDSSHFPWSWLTDHTFTICWPCWCKHIEIFRPGEAALLRISFFSFSVTRSSESRTNIQSS